MPKTATLTKPDGRPVIVNLDEAFDGELPLSFMEVLKSDEPSQVMTVVTFPSHKVVVAGTASDAYQAILDALT